MRQVAVPWARPESGFTLLFEALLIALMAEMPVKAVADLVGEHDTRLWRVLHHYVDRAREATSAAGVTTVGIDETSARRGHDYISLFCDLDVPRLVFATPTRETVTVARFACDLRAHGGDPDRVVRSAPTCTRPTSPASASTCRAPRSPSTATIWPRSSPSPWNQIRWAESKTRRELKGTRYMWLKHPDKLTARQQARLAYLQAQTRGLATARAYRWRLAFDAFFDQPPELAEEYLARWYEGAIRSRLEPIKEFAYTIGDHWEGVLRWHRSKVNNGILEAFNSLIQAAKRRTRGYRTKENLIAMAYLVAGKLDLQLAHTGRGCGGKAPNVLSGATCTPSESHPPLCA